MPSTRFLAPVCIHFIVRQFCMETIDWVLAHDERRC